MLNLILNTKIKTNHNKTGSLERKKKGKKTRVVSLTSLSLVHFDFRKTSTKCNTSGGVAASQVMIIVFALFWTWRYT
jgi:hypothetical protein